MPAPPPLFSPVPTPGLHTHTTSPHGITSTYWEFPKKTLLQKLGLKKVENTSVVSKIDASGKQVVVGVVGGGRKGRGGEGGM